MKRLTALLLAVSLLLSLSACGGSSSSAPDSAEPSSVSTPASDNAEKSAAPAEAEPSDAAEADIAESSDFDSEMYACYGLLNSDQKTVYCQIAAAVEQGISGITLSADVTRDEFGQAAQAVYLDQPQLFWLENSWSMSYDPATDYVVSAEVGFNELADDLDANISAFNAAAEEILNTLDGMTDTEKERAIHDYLVSAVDYESGSLDQTAYGALVGHSAVCEGYTRAFQYLMLCEGIPTYVAEGEAVNTMTGSWESHAWNIVKLGDGYYNVDVTWDDPFGNEDGYIHYTYYNRTDADLSADHVRDEHSSALPACNADEYSFESLYGIPAELGVTEEMGLTRSEPVTSLDEFYQVLQADITAAGTGTHTFSYAIVGDDLMDGINEGMDSGDFFTNAVEPAIESFGLNGYSYSCSGEYTDLGNGYYYDSLEITIN